jgi:alpha-galactosidase/6-phospho-beta-glucosidase family protein
VAEEGLPATIQATTDRREAIKDAKYVVGIIVRYTK